MTWKPSNSRLTRHSSRMSSSSSMTRTRPCPELSPSNFVRRRSLIPQPYSVGQRPPSRPPRRPPTALPTPWRRPPTGFDGGTVVVGDGGGGFSRGGRPGAPGAMVVVGDGPPPPPLPPPPVPPPPPAPPDTLLADGTDGDGVVGSTTGGGP